MSDSIIKVNMADIKICRPPDMLKTLGLGSCVGVVIYDKRSHISGMAHIMLPDSKYINDKGSFDISKCHLIAYANGSYFALGKKLGTFGYSVRKKKK